MNLKKIVESLNLQVKTCEDSLDREVTGGYAGDMLSDVLVNSKDGNLWITLQTHINIVAVASMKGLSGIVIVNGRVPDKDTLKKAEEEKIPILISKLPTYKLVCELCKIGLR